MDLDETLSPERSGGGCSHCENPLADLEVHFAAVSVAPEQPAWTARAGTGGTIEIAFASGVQLRITGAVDPATLTAAVAALSGGRAR
jgi:hypothetical protein